MRILMFSAIFPPAIGGPATQSFNLCKALVKKNIFPVVVTYHESKNFSVSSEFGFKVYSFRSIYTGTYLDKAIRWVVFPFYIFFILLKERIDILHCHSVSVLSFISGFMAKILGKPAIIKFAGDWVWETLSSKKVQAKDFREIYDKSLKSKFMTWVEKVGLGLFDKIWVVSEFRKENIKFLLGNTDKVVVINNCLLFEDQGGNSGSVQGPVTVVSANRFIPHKRIPFLVELFAEMNIPDSRLILVGGGDENEKTKTEEIIKKYHIENKVTLTGILPINEVYKIFSKSSFYISTSLEEGFPNVFIEAMHYGLPVITSDAGGSRELVVDGESGFVIDTYDKNGFIEKMRLLSENILLREEMSHKSYERSKLFNLEYKIGEFISMYKSLL